jgi:uncharacterized damage-inducible protein DinB
MDLISSITAEYRRYKALAQAAVAQLSDVELAQPGVGETNSITVIMWHISGNLRSRFLEFRTTDGEKPWRNRDEEFEERQVTREELLERWESGWETLFAELGALTHADLSQSVTVRSQRYSIHEALHRSLAHTSYHVGQIVHIAKSIRGARWQSLSIPKGQSSAYNQNPRRESGESHAAALRDRAQDQKAK